MWVSAQAAPRRPHAATSTPPRLGHQPTHWLTHCLARGPRLSVHLLPQQLRVEEGGLAQVLG